MKKFKTESKKLLDLMINSIYTNKEIFLRELISNASDAVDKLYFKSLTDDSVAVDRSSLAITVAFDKDARTVTVSDCGIGMTKEELETNLGTIAHSGSQEFKTLNQEAQGSDVDIIGQFGVGFYSAFMVAKQVTVVSKAYGSDEAYSWTSDGVEGYTIKPAERESFGTSVILELKDNSEEENLDSFLSEYGLKSLIKKYSNYVRYPIQMEVTKSRTLPVPEDAPEGTVPEREEYTELETINSMIPIWKRSKSDVTDQEYAEYYKSDYHDYADPLRTIKVHAEGALEYDALMFIPSRAPFDYYSRDFKSGLQLYSSNVKIMDKCEELLPDYFNFVRGVVDSADLQLNISRETLQHNHQLRAIANKLEKKIKSELASMRDTDRPTYEQFFAQFGRQIKYGIYTSYGMKRDLLGDLILYYSAKQHKLVTLDEYLADMPVEQASIYYASGSSLDRMAALPQVSAVLAKGFDVLLCNEDVDEFVIQSMMAYGQGEASKEFKNVTSGDLDLATQEEKDAAEATSQENSQLLEAMKDALGDEVVKVVVSTRAMTSPACVTTEGPVSLEMERLLASMPGSDEMGGAPRAQRVLELNPDHQVFQALQAAQSAGEADKVKTYACLLYNQALLVEGIQIEDPAAFAQAVCSLMK